jgi:hypothetical protein
MRYSIQFELSGLSAMRKSDMNAVVRKAYEKVGEYWHKNFRAKHFSNLAYQEYGYQPRSKAYNRRKLKYLKHNLPLVFTGQSRDLSKSRTIYATKNGVSVTMPVRAFNFRRTAKSPDMQKEFRTVSDKERAILHDIGQKVIEKEIIRFNRRKTKL